MTESSSGGTAVEPDWAGWSPPWAGVSAKLVHARRHLTLLYEAFRDFIEQPPITPEFFPATELGPNWLRCEVQVDDPPALIPLILGDCLHNLRCALDHSLTAIDRRAGRRLSFPIAETETEFERFVNDWIEARGGEGALAAIRARQPFTDVQGRDPQDYYLRILSRLSNEDKHRVLNLVSVGVSDEYAPRISGRSEATVVNLRYVLPTGRGLRQRETALYIELDVPLRTPGLKVELECRFPLSLAVDGKYFNIVNLGDGLHDAVVQTCSTLRHGSLNDWA